MCAVGLRRKRGLVMSEGTWVVNAAVRDPSSGFEMLMPVRDYEYACKLAKMCAAGK
jgi:hypothetical protein